MLIAYATTYQGANDMVTITLIRTHKGNGQELHVGGCADIKKSHDFYQYGKPVDYSGETLLEAIKSADQDMAWWFGEEAYTQSSRDNGCWTTLTSDHAPCYRALVKAAKITFDPETGEPR